MTGNSKMIRGMIRAGLIAALLFLMGAVAGCAKDAVLGFANAVMTNLGDNVLTKAYELTGHRTFGDDSYTGTYSANYDKATVREHLFGNTSILRKEGDEVTAHIRLNAAAGDGRLLLERGAKDPEVLFEGSGTADIDIPIEAGSAYVIFEAEDFTGELDLEIE